jgi:hypothetical protein
MDDLSIIGPEWPGEARDERLEHEDQMFEDSSTPRCPARLLSP